MPIMETLNGDAEPKWATCTVSMCVALQPVVPVVQLVTSKPSDVGIEFESRCRHTNWNFFLTKKNGQQVEND